MLEDRLRGALERAVGEAAIAEAVDYAVVRRARRRVALTALVGALACVALTVTGVKVVAAGLGDDGGRAVQPAHDDDVHKPVVREEIPEEFRAEIFAFRALAATGLMDPLSSRTYNWTYDDDTAFEDGRWSVGFAASDCAPKGSGQTCTGLSGEDPELGNARTDTFVVVALEDGTWRVVAVEGNMLPEERERLIGFSLPDRRERSHWDFASTALLRMGGEASADLTPIWVGPYPTRAPGSVCELQLVDGEGEPVGRPEVFYQEPPDREFERGGWVHGRGVGDARGAADAVVECRPRTGPGWKLAAPPAMQGEPGAVFGVSFELVWRGGKGFTAPAVCEATLVDESGEVVWEGSRRMEALWRPGELKHYPYEGSLVVDTRGRMIDAVAVGETSCRSL
ncbi:MAG TPA: hypothetical protein VG318_01230 [Actinomycetota bacterium]|nr:hypothetical protein [Actinomycetota bacterium]